MLGGSPLCGSVQWRFDGALIRAAGLGLLMLAGACANATEPEPVEPPDLKMTVGLRAPPQARLYADCIAEAAKTRSYQRERDGGTLRFTCTGPTAKWFYDGLDAWSAKIGAQFVDQGRTWRFSKKPVKDSYGLDHCSTDGVGGYECVVILAVGEFIEQLDYRILKS